VYLLFRKEDFFKAIFQCAIAVLPAVIISLIWYYVTGDRHTYYELSGGFTPWLDIYLIDPVLGLWPWIILPFISLFFLKYRKPNGSIKQIPANVSNRILAMDNMLLFSLAVIVISFLFYSIFACEKGVFILLIYPFIAIFLARYFIYLTDQKPVSVRISTSILLGMDIIAIFVAVWAYANTLRDPGWIGLLGIMVLLCAVVNSLYLLFKRINIKILMAGFGLMFALHIFMDSYICTNYYCIEFFFNMLRM
jgi:MFS family permease